MPLEEWRHWLEWAQHLFLVWTDRKNLEYIRTAKCLNARQARWALSFNGLNFTFSYKPGSINTEPDTLSCLPDHDSTTKNLSYILPSSCAVTWGVERRVLEVNAYLQAPVGCPPNQLFVLVSLRSQVIHSVYTLCISCPSIRRDNLCHQTMLLEAVHGKGGGRVCCCLYSVCRQ